MAKFARPANRKRIYAFGKAYDFYLVTSNGSQGNLVEGRMLNEPRLQNGVATNDAEDYTGTLGNPTTSAKYQVVLHCTAANHSAEQTVGWWNSPASPPASAQFVVERTAVAQAARPAPTAGADLVDTSTADVVLIMGEDTIAYHAGLINAQSIGIEIANVGWGFYLTNTTHEPSLAPACNPQSSCPERINIAGSGQAPVWRCNCRRPADHNRYIHLQQPLGGYTDYQGFEDGQYRALILLLRHLAIAHAVPKRFFGDTTAEVFKHWFDTGTAAEKRLGKNRVFHFRGILHHRNVHPSKPCPGVVHRNRLFRGIIDEWWLPIELGGAHRRYYSGPFENPPFVTGEPTRPSLFRWTGYQAAGPTVEAVTYRNADLDALTESKSFFDLDRVPEYYAACETRNGGTFPIGINHVWHGGVHLFPPASNPAVYAAASGVIVAARVASNEETDRAPTFGSQRFVLIRHYVHLETAADPSGVGTSTDWTVEPKRLFSLYMHLDPVADLEGEDNANPPWFNLFRRRNPDLDVGQNDAGKGIVFNPDIEVSVGDILGAAGRYNGRRCLHFEVFSHRDVELGMAPFNVANLRVDDSDDTDAICDAANLVRLYTDLYSDGLDVADVLRGAPNTRNAKTLHKSEWSLASADALKPAVPDEAYRKELWKHIERLTFWSDAIAANAALRDQMGQDGIVWHYHPITFMKLACELVIKDNRQLHEDDYPQTNVELDGDFFLTQFLRRQGNAFVAAPSDRQVLRPYNISSAANVYHFTRDEVACRGCRDAGQHPTTTRVHLALIDLVEQVRLYLDFPLDISLGHVCAAHQGENALCVMNDAASVGLHHRGLAIDICPVPPKNGANINFPLLRQRCTSLWRRLSEVVDTWFNPLAFERGGTPAQDTLPVGYCGMRLRTFPEAVQTSLEAGQAINNNAVAAAFRIHLELLPVPAPAEVEVEVLPVRLLVTIESLRILNDLDVFGRGEWELSVSINGTRLNSLAQSLTTGQVVPLGGSAWTREVTIDPAKGEELLIETDGVERDVFFDDDPGKIKARLNMASTPHWGIGRHALMSPTGAYEITIRVESQNARVTSI